jgi:hypothetical protein
MLAKFLECDHRQQAWASPSSCHSMKRRRRLRDLLTVTAAELFPHRLDDFPLARRRFKRSSDVFAKFAQTMAAAALAARRRINDHPLPWKMLGERLALGTLARKSAHSGRLGGSLLRGEFVLSRVGLQLFESQRQLLDQPR